MEPRAIAGGYLPHPSCGCYPALLAVIFQSRSPSGQSVFFARLKTRKCGNPMVLPEDWIGSNKEQPVAKGVFVFSETDCLPHGSAGVLSVAKQCGE